mgnify:CR=1 FL=1
MRPADPFALHGSLAALQTTALAPGLTPRNRCLAESTDCGANFCHGLPYHIAACCALDDWALEFFHRSKTWRQVWVLPSPQDVRTVTTATSYGWALAGTHIALAQTGPSGAIIVASWIRLTLWSVR